VHPSNRPPHDSPVLRSLLLLTPAVTLVVATEFIVVGLLPLVATELYLSLATSGQLTAVFALSAAVAGPFVTLAATRFAPCRMLPLALLVYALGNIVVAMASSFPLMLAARVVQGALLPAFISIGSAEVARLAPPEQRGRAVAHSNLGFVLGVLIALPAGIALAEGGNWRLPFMVLAVALVPAAAAVFFLWPRSKSSEARVPSRGGQLALLRQPRFFGHLLLSVVLFTAMFSAYTFLGAWSEGALGMSSAQIALLLAFFGAVGLAGNQLAARIADHVPLLGTVVAVVALAFAVNAAARMHSVWAALFPLAVWSVTHTTCVTLSQVRVAAVGIAAPAFAMTLNVSLANLGIALGAFIGGEVINVGGLPWIGMVSAALAPVVLLLTWALSRGHGPAPSGRGDPCSPVRPR
jgi:MFS transporter, DHA1 family, inner membrane transport protein